MSKRGQRWLAGILAVFLCVLGAAAGWSLAEPEIVSGKGKDKVDGMIFWGTSGLGQMQKLIQTEKYADASGRDVETEYGQHIWVTPGGGSAKDVLNRTTGDYSQIGYGYYGSGYDHSGYAILQDWYSGWDPDNTEDRRVTGEVNGAQEWKFDSDEDQRKPTAQGGSNALDLANVLPLLDQAYADENLKWGHDEEEEGGNGNEQKGDGIAIVIWAGEDWVVRNWDSSDLGFVGQEDGGRSNNMDTYSTQNVLLKYWMGLNAETIGSSSSHKYDPSPWSNEIDDGSIMHQKSKDDGVSGDDLGTWNGDGTWSAGTVNGKDLLEEGDKLSGHVGDQEVAVTTCNDSLYPNIETNPRLNDIKTKDELNEGTNGKGSDPNLVNPPDVNSGVSQPYAYSKNADGGTETSGDDPAKYHVQPAGNSKQVSDQYTEQWVESENGYQDLKNSGFSYNGVDDGINIDLSTHKLAETTDDIGDGYANGKKESLATQCGTLFARVLSGYDYEVEYLTQDQDASAIPHNTDDTALDDWYEITYLYVTKVDCKHYNVDCWVNCNQFKACNQQAYYAVSAERIRVRSRCDTTKDAGGTSGNPTTDQQTSGEANTGYADSYHIHVLGGVGMYDIFPKYDGIISVPPATMDDEATCDVPASGFTVDYDNTLVGKNGDNYSREDSWYDKYNRNQGAPDSIGHTCWEHEPVMYEINEEPVTNVFDEGTYPNRPQKVNNQKDPSAHFAGVFDFCEGDHWTPTGDYPGKCPICPSHCCDHSVDPPKHCTCPQSYQVSWGCPYYRVLPVIEVDGFKDPNSGRTTHNIIPSEFICPHCGTINLNDFGTQAAHAEHASAAQRYLRTWGSDDAVPYFVGHIGPNAQAQEAESKYHYGMIPYETATNPYGSAGEHEPSSGGEHEVSQGKVNGIGYQEGSNFINYKQDSHVYIRTWYTNPNKPIMKYVTETRHVNGYIETWLDKYPDAKVYVFGLGPYSKSTTEDTMDNDWTSSRSVTDPGYWSAEFGRDTNYDGRINGLDRVSTNNQDSADVASGNSQPGPDLTQLTSSATGEKGKYTDTEGLWGTADNIDVRNEELLHMYTVNTPNDGDRDYFGIAFESRDALKKHLQEEYPTLSEGEIDAKISNMLSSKQIFEINGKYYENGSWLDLDQYGGHAGTPGQKIDEIARTNRIDNARKEYNDALKANLKNATFVDIWDLVLEHNPYFQYQSITDSAGIQSGGHSDGVNAYHGKYYDQTTYSWIFHMMWATVLNDNPEDEAKVDPVNASLYDMSAALTAYANTVLSPKGRNNSDGSGLVGSGDGSGGGAGSGGDPDYNHKLPDLTSVGFFGAGAALGYGDSAYGFTPSVVVPTSNSSSTVDYRSLVKVEMGDDNNDPNNSAMYIYARYGHLLQDLGLDETGLESTISPRMAPGLITSAGYIGNAALGVVWNVAFEIMDKLNPFRFLIGTTTDGFKVATGTNIDEGGDATTDPFEDGKSATGIVDTAEGTVAAPGIDGLSNEFGTEDGLPNAMKPLVNYITSIYLVLRGIGLWIVLPLMLALFFASVLMLRKQWSNEAMKFLVPFVFIVVGVPMLGAMYTSVLKDCREMVNMSASPSSQLMAATFVDFQGWVERSRLAPPIDAGVEGGTTSVELVSAGVGGSDDKMMTSSSSYSGHAGDKTLGQLRQIAWSINKSTNVIPSMNGESSVWNNVTAGSLDDYTYWDDLMVGLKEENGADRRESWDGTDAVDWVKSWTSAMAASNDIIDMLWRYTNGDMYFASTFSSDSLSHFSKYYPGLVGSGRSGSATTDSNSSTDADEFEPDGTPLTVTGGSGSTYDEMDNKWKLYGLFASTSHGDDWLNRSYKENELLLIGANVDLTTDDGDGGNPVETEGLGQNFTGYNPFANGRISAESSKAPADADSTITFKRDSATTFALPPVTGSSTPAVDASAAVKDWDQKSGLDWNSTGGLSTVAMFSYLSSDFGDASVNMYSSRNVVNLHQEKAHYSVTTVGSGATGTIYWLNCVLFMLCCCVIGFIYALGMTIQNLKSGLSMLMTLPAAMLGVKKSIVAVCALVVSLIFEIVSSVALYNIVAQVMMVLVTLGDQVSNTSFGKIQLAAPVGGVLAERLGMANPEVLHGMFGPQLLYMALMCVVMLGLSVAAVKLAPALARVNGMAFDVVMVKFIMPRGAMGGYLAARAEARAKAERKQAGKARARVRRRIPVGDLVPVENTACETAGQGL